VLSSVAAPVRLRNFSAHYACSVVPPTLEMVPLPQFPKQNLKHGIDFGAFPKLRGASIVNMPATEILQNSGQWRYASAFFCHIQSGHDPKIDIWPQNQISLPLCSSKMRVENTIRNKPSALMLQIGW